MTQRLILRHGDCVEVLGEYEDASIGAVVSDPPYHISFMGKTWDAEGAGIAFSADLWDEVYRVLRPGGVIKAFSGTRTFHRMTQAMAEAGFTDLRIESWNYGSGFPKSLNIGKALDKRPGAVAHYPEIKKFLADAIKTSPKTRSQVDEECGFSACDFARTNGSSPFVNVIPDAHKWSIMKGVLGFDPRWDKAVEAAERAVIGAGSSGSTAMWTSDGGMGEFDITAPATEVSQRWDGWGTALKPSWEPVVVGRKP
jgi:hypothetical protein